MKSGRLVNFPVSFFSVVMGLAGTAIAFSKAETVLDANLKISWFILGFSFLNIFHLYCWQACLCLCFFSASERCLLSEGMKSVSKNKTGGNNAGFN